MPASLSVRSDQLSINQPRSSPKIFGSRIRTSFNFVFIIFIMSSHIILRVDHRRPLHIVGQADHHRNQYAHPSVRPPSTPTYRRLGRSSSKSICTSFRSTSVDPYISSIRTIIIEINMHILRVGHRRPLQFKSIPANKDYPYKESVYFIIGLI